MAEPLIVTNGEVKGDITSCKIENQLKKVQRDSLTSVSEKNTYISYDVCSKSVVDEYTVPSFTGVGFIILAVLFMLGVVGAVSAIGGMLEGEKEVSLIGCFFLVVTILLYFWIF